MKTATRFAAIMLFIGTSFAQVPMPRNGYVPDEKTAVRIAEAVLEPILSKQQFVKAQPFIGELHEGIWIVYTKPIDTHIKGGGTPEIHIDQKTAAVLSLNFSK